MILALIIRRWWLIKNRFLPFISFLVMLPILLHIVVTMVMKRILVKSINNIPYELWVFPGIIMIISIITLFPLLYRDLFDLRIHKKSLMPMTLAPVNKSKLITAFLITASLESFVYVFIGMGIINSLNTQAIHWKAFIFMPVFSLGFSSLMGNIMISLSLLTDRISTYLSSIIILLVIILFGSGILVEFEFYPHPIGQGLSLFPTSMILSALRAIIFYSRIYWLYIFIPMWLTLLWTWGNGLLLKRKLKQ